MEGLWLVTGWGSYDSKLQHVIEFLFCDLEAFECETTGVWRHRRPCGLYVVEDIMLDRTISSTGLGQGGEIGEKGKVGVRWVQERLGDEGWLDETLLTWLSQRGCDATCLLLNQNGAKSLLPRWLDMGDDENPPWPSQQGSPLGAGGKSEPHAYTIM